jgi:signal transduction histidine kinase
MTGASLAERREGYGISGAVVAVAVAAAGVIASGLTAWLCATSRTLVDPTGTALWRTAFVASYAAAGAYLWWRRPHSRLGPLVAGVGFLYSIASLNASDAPLAYTLGMVAWVTVIVYLAYVYVCFPHGRLESRIERVFVLGLVVSTGLVWGLILVLSPTLPLGGSFSDCGARCPPNALQIIDGGAAAGTALNTAFNVVTTISLIGIAMLIFNKARSSAYVTRRAMTPLTLAFLANIVEFVIFLFAGPAYPGARQVFRIADGVVTLAVPGAILAGQLRSNAYAARSLGEFWLRVPEHPLNPAAIQDMVARALGDPSLRIAMWQPDDATYVDINSEHVQLPPADGLQTVTHVTRDGWPVAALIHDPRLETDSDMVEGVAEASLMLLENWRLLAELRASRSRLIGAAELERQRIERDLHDGAQQSLLAIELKVAMARDATDPYELERQLNAIQREAEAATEELRQLTHGIYPQVLHDFGLPAALRALADRATIPVQVSSKGIGRYSEAIEAAAYFCTREAIQNATKHAGPAANVTVRLAAGPGAIWLGIDDDGIGMAPERATTGIGIIGMRDRIEALGGAFELISAPGHGTSIRARIPAGEAADRPAPR